MSKRKLATDPRNPNLLNLWERWRREKGHFFFPQDSEDHRVFKQTKQLQNTWLGIKNVYFSVVFSALLSYFLRSLFLDKTFILMLILVLKRISTRTLKSEPCSRNQVSFRHNCPKLQRFARNSSWQQ